MGWQPAEIPTARFTAMVKTFITMPMIACGAFAPYLLCAPYFASMFMETIVMMTMESCVRKLEKPSFPICPITGRSGTKSEAFSWNDFVWNRYWNTIRNETILPIVVAIAAPATSMCMGKMKSQSRTIFRRQPLRPEAIATFGAPSARTMGVRLVPRIVNGSPSRIQNAYSSPWTRRFLHLKSSESCPVPNTRRSRRSRRSRRRS